MNALERQGNVAGALCGPRSDGDERWSLPERAHTNVLTPLFGWAFADAFIRWSEWPEAEIEKCSEVATSPKRSKCAWTL